MDYYADIGVQILFLIMLGLSLNLLLGYAGEMSMAHATFFGVGAYTVGLLTLPPAVEGTVALTSVSGLGWSIWLGLLVAVPVSFAVASLISLPAVSRVRGSYMILLTLAFQIVANQLMGSLRDVTGGTYGMTPIPPLEIAGQSLAMPVSAFFVLLVVTILIGVICYGLGESPFGRLLRGIREQEAAVKAVGKDTVRPKLLIFGLAAAIAGFAGGLNASYYQFAAPGSFSLNVSILIVAIVVLGGAGNLLGTVLAAVVLGSLPPLLRGAAGDEAIAWQAVIYGLALVVLIRFRPSGLIPEGTSLTGWFRRPEPALATAGGGPGTTAATPSATASPPAVAEPAERAAPPAPAATAEPTTAPVTAPDDRAPADGTVLRVEGLSKRFGGIQAVEDVTFELRKGQITALIGPNGAGKTTIFNLITGTMKPDRGNAVLNGRDITHMSTHKIARLGMTRSFQDGRLFQRLTARDNVAMAIPGQPGENLLALGVRPLRSFRHEATVREQAADALTFVGLQDKADEIVANLSFGDQRLVAIARLLATQCDVLLLDEPTSGVDPQSVEHVMGVVRGLRDVGKTVCLVEHSIHVVTQLADHGIFLDQGQVLAEGSVEYLMEQKHLTEIYFG